MSQKVLQQFILAVERGSADHIAENLISAFFAEANEADICDLATNIQKALENQDITGACGLDDEWRLAIILVRFSASWRHCSRW